MTKKLKAKAKIFRNGKEVVPSEENVLSVKPSATRSSYDEPEDYTGIILGSKEPQIIDILGQQIFCSDCDHPSPTKRMYKYKQSSHGEVVLCEGCNDNAVEGTFSNLDALDKPRKLFKRKLEK